MSQNNRPKKQTF